MSLLFNLHCWTPKWRAIEPYKEYIKKEVVATDNNIMGIKGNMVRNTLISHIVVVMTNVWYVLWTKIYKTCLQASKISYFRTRIVRQFAFSERKNEWIGAATRTKQSVMWMRARSRPNGFYALIQQFDWLPRQQRDVHTSDSWMFPNAIERFKCSVFCSWSSKRASRVNHIGKHTITLIIANWPIKMETKNGFL